MKFKKLIPALAILLFATPAFAEVETTTMDTTLGFELEDFFRIERGASENTEVDSSPNDTYTKLQLQGDLKAHYVVYTNKATGDGITFTATCPHSGTDDNAFQGTTANAFYLIFSNKDADTLADDAAMAGVKSPAAGKVGSDNPNVIKLKVTPTVTKKANSANGVATDTPVAGTFANNAKYTFGNGKYDCVFQIAREAETNTFSTADTAGVYQATITITRGTT